MKTPHLVLSLGLLGVGLTANVGTVGWWGLQALVASMDKTVVATQAITLGDMMHAQKGAQEEVKHVPAEAKSQAEGLLQHIHQLQRLSFPPELKQGVTRLERAVRSRGVAVQKETGHSIRPPHAEDNRSINRLAKHRDQVILEQALSAYTTLVGDRSDAQSAGC